MSVENKRFDLVIDANVSYSLLLEFTEEEGKSTTTVDLTGCTIVGDIKKELTATSSIGSFVGKIVDATRGVASISLPLATVNTLSAQASTDRDSFNSRQRFVGYYDIILKRKVGSGSTAVDTSSRIMEGLIYISDGVTK